MVFLVYGMIALVLVLLALEWLAGTSVQNFKRAAMGAGALLLVGIGLIMVVTGKALFSLPAFAGAGVLFSRIRTFAGLFGMFRAFRHARQQNSQQSFRQNSNHGGASGQGRMDRSEAAKTLGIEENANADDVKSAHKQLMQRLHPDAGGNDYLAAKLNEARDVMLDGR